MSQVPEFPKIVATTKTHAPHKAPSERNHNVRPQAAKLVTFTQAKNPAMRARDIRCNRQPQTNARPAILIARRIEPDKRLERAVTIFRGDPRPIVLHPYPQRLLRQGRRQLCRTPRPDARDPGSGAGAAGGSHRLRGQDDHEGTPRRDAGSALANGGAFLPNPFKRRFKPRTIIAFRLQHAG